MMYKPFFRKLFIAIIISSIALPIVSCRNKTRKEAINTEREKWENSLKDSLSLYEKELSEAETQLPFLREEVENLLTLFIPVNNPREVEGYYIYRVARAGYPLTSTGITARLSKNERPEIIAALSGGEFSSIRIGAPGSEPVTSETVPYDQALNYRAGGLNTVAFMGAQADSLLRYVVKHSTESLTLEFLNPSVVKTVKISDSERETLVETGRLVETRQRLMRLEAEIPSLSNKIRRLKSR